MYVISPLYFSAPLLLFMFQEVELLEACRHDLEGQVHHLLKTELDLDVNVVQFVSSLPDTDIIVIYI